MENHPNAYFLASVLKSNVTRLSHPFKISWAVTYGCNLRCGMCNIWKRPNDRTELTVDEAGDFFRKAGKFSWVGLTGGEPFLRRDIDAIADVVVRENRPLKAVHVNTNGQLPERVTSFAEGMRARHPRIKTVITVSLDGPPTVHDAIRGRPGAFDKAAETFKALKAVGGIKAQIGYTVVPANFGKFREALEALKEVYPDLRPDDVNVNVFQTSGVYYDNM